MNIPHLGIGKVALAFALSVSSLFAHAQVYKCKDDSGRIVYSGKPCEYEGKALGLSDNTIQGEAPPSQINGDGTRSPSNNRFDGSRLDPGSPRCIEISEELHKLADKEPAKGIVEAYRERGHFNRLSKEYELTCLGVVNTDDTRSRTKPKPSTASRVNPYIGQPSVRCSDGSYVRGTSCQLCPDGSYVPGGSGCQLTPDGKYVQSGKRLTLCADGSYVAGACRLGPNGRYYGE